MTSFPQDTVDSFHYHIGGGGVPADSLAYVKRSADDQLYELLQAGEYCYVLNARQMGKSSLRLQTMARLQAAGVVCGAMDFSVAGATDQEWYFWIVDRLATEFRLNDGACADWWEAQGRLPLAARFVRFLQAVVLAQVPGRIVIFLDEIDTTRSLDFTDDFFAALRECYERRPTEPEFRRLAFVLLGVSTPSDLMVDKVRSPFNIGRAIDLQGFQFEEAQPLLAGLARVPDAAGALRSILDWTGGQPFLTQKVCHLVGKEVRGERFGSSTELVDYVVRTHVIDNWEMQDEPQHLRTIRDRIVQADEARRGALLGVCQQVLRGESVAAVDSWEQAELRLSGLVVKRGGVLQVYNPIYAAVFGGGWCDRLLGALRPYGEALRAWEKSGDESWLLTGKAYTDACTWAEGKQLGDTDYRFLTASQGLENQETQRRLGVLQEEKTILLNAQEEATRRLRKASRRVRKSTLLVVGLLIFAAGLGIYNRQTWLVAELDRKSNTALVQGQTNQFLGLINAIKSGERLQRMLPYQINHKYPTTAPIYALQQNLESTRYLNLLTLGGNSEMNLISLKRDRIISPCSRAYDSTEICIWDTSGKLVKQFKLLDQKFESDVRIYGMNVNPNSSYVAAILSDNTVNIWNNSGKLVKSMPLNKFGINKVNQYANNIQFSPSGNRIFVNILNNDINSENSEVIVLDSDGKIAHQFRQERQGFIINSKGSHIITTSEDGSYVYNLSTKQSHKLTSTNSINNFKFNDEGDRILAISTDKIPTLWDLSGKLITTLKNHPAEVDDAQFNPKGDQIITRAKDEIRVWSLSGKLLLEINDKNNFSSVGKRRFNTMGISPDGKYFAIDSGQDIRIVDNEGKLIIKSPKQLSSTEPVMKILFSSKGDHLMLISGPSVRVWSWSQQLAEQHMKRQKSTYLLPSLNASINVKMDRILLNEPQNKFGAGLLDREVRAKLTDLSGKPIADLKIPDFPEIQQRYLSNSNNVLNIPQQKNLTDPRYRLEKIGILFEILHRPNKSRRIIVNWQFGRDKNTIVGTVYIKQGRNNQKISYFFDLLGNQIHDVKRMEDAYRSHQGHGINVLDNDVIQIKDSSGKVTGDISVYRHDTWTNNFLNKMYRQVYGPPKDNYSGITDVSFNSAGDNIITLGRDNKVKLWDLSGKLINVFRLFDNSELDLAEFSPSGSHIVTSGWKGGGTGFSLFWDRTWGLESISGEISHLWTVSGNHLATVSGSSPKVSPHEDQFLSLNDTGGVTIWDLSGRRLAEFKSEKGPILAADFSANGDQIIMSLDDGTVQVQSNETLPQLLTRGCYWLRSYLEDDSDRLDQLPICQAIFEKSE